MDGRTINRNIDIQRRNRTVRGNVAASREARQARAAAATRAEFGGGMGMGIPQGAPSGGGMPAQYGKMKPFEGNIRNNINASRNARGARQAADMRLPIGPNGGGLPSQYSRIPAAAPRSVDLPGGTPVSIRPRPRPAGAGAGIVDDAIDGGKKVFGKKGFLKNGKGLMIGAGAAVIAGLAMNRRGDGTSSGRAGMSRY